MVLGALAGCGEPPGPAPDAQVSDDAPVLLDSAADQASPDASAMDAPPDATSLDATSLDAAAIDATSLDAAAIDATSLDATSDGTPPDAVSGDAVSGDAADAAEAGCAAGQTLCDGACVTLSSDARHCGACGSACPTGQSCVAGRCAIACDPGRVVCPVGASMLCVDLETDANRCGTCDTRCPADQTCTAGRCACPTGQRLCSGACVDAQTDNLNCGGCARACLAGQLCTAGACACPTGATLCGGACVDTASDVTNCGGCGTRCPSGQFCQRGACGVTCDAPRTVCGAGSTQRCADTRADEADCGACGNACPARANATAVCTSGACGIACATGFRDCNASAADGCEVDARSSLANCGACGNACPTRANATATCASGACGSTCNDGFADCDESAATGCEVDLRSSMTNCGACGRACGAGQTCVAGTCTATCGNGRVDPGETCDTAVAGGAAGACPSSCAAPGVCSTVRLTGAGTCSAACETTPITACANGDGCCPSGCNATNDNNCTPRCGNGAVEAGEACDTAIAVGMPGACPASCAPTGTCTAATLTGAGTCAAACTSAPITACASGDGCCPSGCTMTRDADCAPCVDECALGATRCGTGGVQTCALTDGCMLWGAPAACASGLSCVDGICTGASLTISATTELCGVRWYTGDVVIQGGARVTCATGVLEIHARSISVDPSSSIVMTPVTTGAAATRGADGHAATAQYVCPTYYYTIYGCNGGGGGGGAAGAGVTAASTAVLGALNCGGGGYCGYSGTSAGGQATSVSFDDFALVGGAGGNACSNCSDATMSCNTAGGRGGGAVRLYATNSILIAGRVDTAGENGLSGATGPRSGSGGGGGGTVLLRAPDVEFAPTAVVAAAGGTRGAGSTYSCGGSVEAAGGNGGAGLVKVLYTSRFANRATALSTNVSSGLMPPTVTSTTHPDPNRYYNDGFSELRVAWTPSVAGLPGYLTAFNRATYPALTMTTGTFTTATSETIPASRFPGADDYFYTASMLDSGGTPSPMFTAFRVRVNATPPTPTSTSHPSQTAWYPARTVVVRWTLPTAVPASTFNGRIWYRVDHVSNTPPGRAAEGWTSTTATNLSLTTDASGAPLTDGTWYVHLAAEDAMGYLTRVAGHYRVQLGAEPARANYFGYIENAAGVRQTGVTVTLEPYALTATTDASGYFIFNTIYAGTYAMTVTRGTTVLGRASVSSTVVPYTFRLP